LTVQVYLHSFIRCCLPDLQNHAKFIIIIVTRSVQPKPPVVAIVRQNGRSSASCRASVAVTPVSRQIWWVQVVDSMVDHRRVSTPVKAAHHPSSWCRFVGSGLLVHHFEVWRRDRKDPVFACERCTRRRTGRYDAELHREIPRKKIDFKVIQGHRPRCQSKAHLQLPIVISSNFGRISTSSSS